MPQVFKIGSYWVYFWLDETIPLEPVHVSQGKPVPKIFGFNLVFTIKIKNILRKILKMRRNSLKKS